MAGTASGGSRRSRLAPYLLVAPGILWLLVFFVAPTITLAQTSVSGATARGGTATSARSATTAIHFFRSFRYAAGATLLALAMGYPLAYFIAFRAGRLKNLLLGLVVLPFFTTFLVRTFAWKTILNDGGPAVWLLQQLHILGAGRPPARHHDRRDRRAHVQLPAVHDPADLREPREDRPAAGRGGARTSTRRRSARSARWCCRSRCPGCSPAACSPSSRPTGDFINAAAPRAAPTSR